MVHGMTTRVEQLEDIVRRQSTALQLQTEKLSGLEREIAELQTRYDALVAAMQKEFGAHAALIALYSDPSKPDYVRAKAASAALPFEKPRLSAPQQASTFSLYDYLEAARLKKLGELKVIEGKAHDEPPAA
jgi:hypothetical protein